jgi:hypothetical protein
MLIWISFVPLVVSVTSAEHDKEPIAIYYYNSILKYKLTNISFFSL